jgi:hypothetical protein
LSCLILLVTSMNMRISNRKQRERVKQES